MIRRAPIGIGCNLVRLDDGRTVVLGRRGGGGARADGEYFGASGGIKVARGGGADVVRMGREDEEGEFAERRILWSRSDWIGYVIWDINIFYVGTGPLNGGQYDQHWINFGNEPEVGDLLAAVVWPLPKNQSQVEDARSDAPHPFDLLFEAPYGDPILGGDIHGFSINIPALSDNLGERDSPVIQPGEFTGAAETVFGAAVEGLPPYTVFGDTYTFQWVYSVRPATGYLFTR